MYFFLFSFSFLHSLFTCGTSGDVRSIDCPSLSSSAASSSAMTHGRLVTSVATQLLHCKTLLRLPDYTGAMTMQKTIGPKQSQCFELCVNFRIYFIKGSTLKDIQFRQSKVQFYMFNIRQCVRTIYYHFICTIFRIKFTKNKPWTTPNVPAAYGQNYAIKSHNSSF